jgi:hypothetical protein
MTPDPAFAHPGRPASNAYSSGKDVRFAATTVNRCSPLCAHALLPGPRAVTRLLAASSKKNRRTYCTT